ncbi:SDR family oxidoreductase [Fructilactobacillus fructivorans]|uniref:Short-chain dehydrogenase/oxidoreductase n=1 Tax=Fructilactobacillus fructivorans TaxID=1614 RepID=A0A0C1M037_9LACO|nr:SDR family oxidoreductase [Fructilactobacillus fructivorans]KID42485.1 short-chain dehydrogenase/oxidoreductase [Fructilactobacillus fructivorans]MCT0151595.1 SDR family oxidoreductase [Fructilactobacillus fructivorans]MCT2868095.1 SDR family oxidoreductase [Fructilactobacillus fructivorans]MCT2868592.1 SDR family oxidoreductase [Fructilactobacillus fructivorans]MCT2873782.1 SDR family oxidoreductase [Fructilactobacillus fructivorans]
MTIENKVVVITGGSSGMGAATTKLALARGAKVVVGARNQDQLEQLATEVDNPKNFSYRVTDVTKKEDVQELVGMAISQYGQLDVMYNNAGIMPQGPVDDPDRLIDWEKTINTNIMGVLNGIVAAVPQMKQQGQGLIMATDSVAGHVVYPNSAVYNGSKYAVKAIMEGLRQEQHKNGIKTGIVSPGFVDTNLMDTINDDEIRNQIEAGKKGWLSPENIAEIAVFMMSQPENVDINEILVRPTDQDV